MARSQTKSRRRNPARGHLYKLVGGPNDGSKIRLGQELPQLEVWVPVPGSVDFGEQGTYVRLLDEEDKAYFRWVGDFDRNGLRVPLVAPTSNKVAPPEPRTSRKKL